MKVYLLGDSATSRSKKACDTAFVVIGVTAGKHLFLLDGMCHKMSLTEKWINFRNLYEKWARAPGVQSIHAAYETYGSGASDVEYFRSEMKRGVDSTVFEIQELERTIKGQESKKSRIERMEPDLRANRIFVPIYKENMQMTERQYKVLQAMQGNQLKQEQRPIRVLMPDKSIYDLTEIFIDQLTWFPYGSKVDLLDAFSRIYDCAIREPSDLVQRFGRTFSVKRNKIRLSP